MIVYEAYCRDDEYHRDPRRGAARIYRDRFTGVATWEEYYWHDQLHRDPVRGPAVIKRTPKGRVIEQLYYWNGIKQPAPERPNRRQTPHSRRTPEP